MASEPDHAHSGPPNTDTEEEAEPGREPRRRSARTAAKVRVLHPCVGLRFRADSAQPSGTHKATGTQIKEHKGLMWMIYCYRGDLSCIFSLISKLSPPYCSLSLCFSTIMILSITYNRPDTIRGRVLCRLCPKIRVTGLYSISSNLLTAHHSPGHPDLLRTKSPNLEMVNIPK
jgi:hypothetical protein